MPDARLPREGIAAPASIERAEQPCFALSEIALVLPGGGPAEPFAFARRALPAGPWSQPAAEPPCLGVRGINGVLQRLQNAIVERGYVTTRVLAEPQDLSTGTLTLTVVPGRIRAVRIEDDERATATAWNALPTGPGRLLDLRDIEQGLENWKRVPTAEADIQIAPADQPGESDLVVHWRQARTWRASLSADDAGSRATGKRQGSLTLSGDHWAQLNDLFYATLTRDLGRADDRGTRGHVLHYSLPWGYTLIALNASGNLIDLRPSEHIDAHARAGAEGARTTLAPTTLSGRNIARRSRCIRWKRCCLAGRSARAWCVQSRRSMQSPVVGPSRAGHRRRPVSA